MKKLNFKYDEIKKILTTIGVVTILAYFIIYTIYHWDIIDFILNSQVTFEKITQLLSSKTILNFVILILLTSITAAIPFVSNSVFAIFNGVVYGPLLGFLMNICANILGNFLCIRLLGLINITDHNKKFKEKIENFKKGEQKGYGIVLGYMIPIMPTVIVNYTVVEMGITMTKWLRAIFIGVAPISLIYALGGAAVSTGDVKRISIFIIFLLLAYVAIIIYKRRGKTNGLTSNSTRH